MLPDDDKLRKRVLAEVDEYTMKHGLLHHVWWRTSSNALTPIERIVIPKSLKERVLRVCHGQGHSGRLRTYQKLRERFYWKSMYADAAKFVKRCQVCQLHGQKPAAAKVAGHLQVNKPGEKWVIDVLHLPRNSVMQKVTDKLKSVISKLKGGEETCHKVLVAIDVCSRYGVAIAVPDLESGTILRMMEERIIGQFGWMSEIICDNGSEFKAEVSKACKALRVSQHRSVAYHAQGHGVVERFNRTMVDTIAKMVEDSAKTSVKEWLPVLPWAVLAYNSSVNRSNASRTLQWVQQQRTKYEEQMRDRSEQEDTRVKKEFFMGDLVKVHKKIGPRTVAKLSRTKDGPYRVVGVPDDGINTTYELQLVGGTGKKIKAHIETMQEYFDIDEGEEEENDDGHNSESDNDEEEDYDVEEIVGERGNIKKGTKQYLIKYVGYDDTYWTDLNKMYGCDKLIAAWHQRSKKKVSGSAAALVDESAAASVFIKTDLMKLKAKELLERVCAVACCELEDVAYVHASVPCETCSIADATNQGKKPPCNFRDHTVGTRPPRAGDQNDKYRQKALAHDRLVQHVLEAIRLAKEKGGKFAFGIENPVGSLRRRGFMDVSKWAPVMAAKLVRVDYCAYGADWMKPTNWWTSLMGWLPRGLTGNGLCGRKCAAGAWKSNKSGVRVYYHKVGLARDPKIGIRGKGSRRKLNSIPEVLHSEIMDEVVRCKKPQQHVVIDLCAGYGSLKDVAEQKGFKYIAVDIKDFGIEAEEGFSI